MIPNRETWLSGYRTLWMIVMFDLPVVEPEERKAATRFRNSLLDQGFHMAQFSIYYRLLSGRDAAQALERKISASVPAEGSVNILTITDKQYENIKSFKGSRAEEPKKPDQLKLF
ncbi:MAG: CRISPR-associated endonuclease Cas2 [Rhodospirillaceae bacterium]|nr:CRISPR-associated endonuclease Cas2 [Rhodospirillaceae bacterium]MBT6222057.1 CRISPR-associated endonuclease Cas2 [Rhodospirillaceae bacterium]MBT7768483.1 CRISPR-associated endonuclease Cas2 [Rhodospirillales bacterium]